MNYVLDDCTVRNREHPETFEIPNPDLVKRVRTGDFVKLVFMGDHLRVASERMWVKVRKVEGDQYEGVLDNDPYFFMPCDLRCGDVVQFEPKHFAGIIFAE